MYCVCDGISALRFISTCHFQWKPLWFCFCPLKWRFMIAKTASHNLSLDLCDRIANSLLSTDYVQFSQQQIKWSYFMLCLWFILLPRFHFIVCQFILRQINYTVIIFFDFSGRFFVDNTLQNRLNYFDFKEKPTIYSLNFCLYSKFKTLFYFARLKWNEILDKIRFASGKCPNPTKPCPEKSLYKFEIILL